MNREEIKKVIELFKDWYEDNAQNTFDLFDRCDYVLDSFLDSEQAEELMQLQQKTVTDEEITEWLREQPNLTLNEQAERKIGAKWAIDKLK